MTIARDLSVLPPVRWPAIDACDRCLALSALTVVLWSVPLLRGTPRYEELLQRQQQQGEVDKDPVPVAPIVPPLVASFEGLAPTPGELIRAAHGVTVQRADEVKRGFATWSADAVRERCAQAGQTVACQCSTDYPESLRALADPPPVIYVAGDARVLDRCPKSGVGMVGTRRPTRVGRDASRTIAMGIAQAGGIVVSGMALGVDGACHEGALNGRGLTIAVLASGADRPSPNSHARLYEEILERGAVVSELPPGTEPRRWTFPARNRIIAALSDSVIVVEAPRKSGALITVDHAQDLGLDVYAVPGSLSSLTCEGSNRLLCDGAGGVVDGVEFMGLRSAIQGALLPLRAEETAPKPKLRPVDPDQATIHDVLSRGAQTRQEISRVTAASLPQHALEEALTDLELSGWVERGLDGRYRLAERRSA